MSDWKEALEPSPECIDIARLGEPLDASDRAHLDTCARCQTELALFREIGREESTAEEADAARWIADELRRRNNVVAFRPKAWNAIYAVAAVLALVIGAGWWTQLREPSIDGPLTTGVYRGARLELVAPRGDLAQAPNELRWNPVPEASRYRVRIVEVDGTQVWSGDTAGTAAVLPPDAIAQFLPGKSLLWQVEAFRGAESLAVSETQTVRVTP
ncbi:MAG TPA: hypothetical protein VFP80_13300 [Thermoanaerobaculia bacterium]|nr:hypothetical protein [Thermoanaerobaculia bacterium]